ncbi:MAG: hypothetical protein HQL32_16005 [Planctomycetes bacterium]|nr:hypothetical protein [Planctomycetota bacterium]
MIKKFIICSLLITAGLGYYLWKNDELSEEGIRNLAQKVREADIEDLKGAMSETGQVLSEVKDKAMEIGLNLKEELENTNWSELRDKWGLSSEDIEGYKDSLAFVFEDSSQQSTEAGPSQETKQKEPSDDVVSGMASKSTQPSGEDLQVSSRMAPKSTQAPERETFTPEQEKRDVKPTVAVSIKKEPRHYSEAQKLLAQAKENNKKGIPGKPNHLKYLRNAVKLYQKSMSEFQLSMKRDNLSKRQKEEVEELMQQINQQIYWGKKLDRLR